MPGKKFQAYFPEWWWFNGDESKIHPKKQNPNKERNMVTLEFVIVT